MNEASFVMIKGTSIRIRAILMLRQEKEKVEIIVNGSELNIFSFESVAKAKDWYDKFCNTFVCIDFRED